MTMGSEGEVIARPFPVPGPPDPWQWDGESASLVSRHLDLGSVAESQWFRLLAQITSSTLLFVLIFGMSATVDVTHLREQMHNKFAILTGVGTQFLIMPVLGYASVALLTGHGLTEPMAISLLVVTASPGGSYSNWWCSMFNADLALSVTMTAISTMVSAVMLPANLLLYVNAAFGLLSGSEGRSSVMDNIDWVSLFVSLAIVIAAIGMGLCASFRVSSRRFNRFANKIGSLSGILLIVFSAVVSSLSGSNDAQVWGQTWAFYVGVTLPCLVGLCIATFFAVIAKLRKPEVISVGVECCYQNVGIATSAAVAMFDDPVERGQALCVPLFYGLMEAMVLGLYCFVAWKLGWTKAPRDEKFCLMLVTTYEVEDSESAAERDQFVGGRAEGEREGAARRGSSSSPRSAAAENDASSDTWESPSPPSQDCSWWRPWTLFVRRRKRKGSGDAQVAEASPPAKRVSLAHFTNGVSESMSQLDDAITDLVPFPPPKVEYSRCRIGSEDGTAPISEAASNTSPDSAAKESSA